MIEQRDNVTRMTAWLLKHRRDPRRLRPWRVVRHDVAIGDCRERPGQLKITRGWPK